MIDLCYVAERDEEWSEFANDLTFYGKLGVTGAFRAVFGDDHCYDDEVASVFARFLHHLGCLDLAGRVDEVRWRRIERAIADSYGERDVAMSEVITDFGEPSLRVGDRVLCYVDDSTGAWVSFDFWQDFPHIYNREAGRYERYRWKDAEPLLRNIRIPATTFNESLVLTPYGKVIRWGPGWWITHPPQGERTPTGVAKQLLDIQNADPSQSLGPRRP